MDSLIELIAQINDPKALELKSELLKLVRAKTIKKGEFLLRSGQFSNSGYFVKKGLLRSYHIDKNGKENTFLFAPENWFIGDIESEVFKTPSKLFIESVEDSEIEEIDASIVKLFPLFPQPLILQEIYRLLKRNADTPKRVLLLISSSAQERYEDFIATYPEIHNRVPLKMIASYLGITPEALSSIRNRMSKKKFS